MDHALGPYMLNGKHLEIRDVWAENLEEELATIRDVVLRYPFVAMVRGLLALWPCAPSHRLVLSLVNARMGRFCTAARNGGCWRAVPNSPLGLCVSAPPSPLAPPAGH